MCDAQLGFTVTNIVTPVDHPRSLFYSVPNLTRTVPISNVYGTCAICCCSLVVVAPYENTRRTSRGRRELRAANQSQNSQSKQGLRSQEQRRVRMKRTGNGLCSFLHLASPTTWAVPILPAISNSACRMPAAVPASLTPDHMALTTAWSCFGVIRTTLAIAGSYFGSSR